MLTAGLVIILLIAVNALFVAAEFAAVSVRPSRIHQLAQEGNSRARRLLPSLTDSIRLDRYVATCQVGITISSLALGAYGQATLSARLAPLFESWGGLETLAAQSTSAVIVLIALTVLQVILGELVPKSLALQFPTQAALYTAEPMRWSESLLSWFTWILNGSGALILKLFGRPSGGHRHIHSPEEIDMLMVKSRDGGLLEPEEQKRLHEAIQLRSRSARELMVPRRQVAAIDAGTPINEVLERVAGGPFTRLPVYRGSLDNIVGVLHTKDLVLSYKRGSDTITDALRPPLFVPGNMTAYRLLRVLREGKSHQAMVLDESGRVEGLITLEDILAEVFGELSDEFKGGVSGGSHG